MSLVSIHIQQLITTFESDFSLKSSHPHDRQVSTKLESSTPPPTFYACCLTIGSGSHYLLLNTVTFSLVLISETWLCSYISRKLMKEPFSKFIYKSCLFASFHWICSFIAKKSGKTDMHLQNVHMYLSPIKQFLLRW